MTPRRSPIRDGADRSGSLPPPGFPDRFFADGEVSYPYLSDGMWFLTQHRRWGLLKDEPDYVALAKKVNRIDVYAQAAAAAKVPLPKAPMRSAKLMDGVVWDGSAPAAYAGAFRIKVA